MGQYRAELEALDRMLEVTEEVEGSKQGVRDRVGRRAFSAVGIGREKASSTAGVGLKGEIHRSQKRCLRAKSGVNLGRIVGGQIERPQEPDRPKTMQ